MTTTQHPSYSLQSSNSPEPIAKSASLDLNAMMGFLVLVLPITFLLGVAAYRKHQASTLRRQVRTLEKLWLLNSTEKLS